MTPHHPPHAPPPHAQHPQPAHHHLCSGQSVALALPAGTELFCSHGVLQLQTAPWVGLDAAPGGLGLQLHPGQSWRAPQPVHLQACALYGPVRLLCQTPPAAAYSPPVSTTRGWLAAVHRLLPRWPTAAQPK